MQGGAGRQGGKGALLYMSMVKRARPAAQTFASRLTPGGGGGKPRWGGGAHTCT